MPRRKLDIKISAIAATIATILLLVYYLRGLNFLPQTVLLPVAGQVLSVGVHAVATIAFSSLTRYSTHHPVPLDAVTPFLISIDTLLGGLITPERLFLAPFISLLMLHTPETLLGTLAAEKQDIRSVRTRKEKVEVGPFGGGRRNNNTDDLYYLSGQILLAATNPDKAYRQVVYLSPVGWILPRKPVPWYEVFAQNLQRDNDAEKRITIDAHEAAILVPVASIPRGCNRKNISDFGFTLCLHHCGSYIGFTVSGNLPNTQGFYRVYRGTVSAKYASRHGERYVEGSVPRNMIPAEFPRVESFWESQASCFLNLISFNRPSAKIGIIDRLALSSVIRIAGFDDSTGFSTPPAMVDAVVSDVVTTNVSRFVVLTTVVAVAIEAVRVLLSKFKFEILSPELEPLVASFRGVPDLSQVGRSVREGRGWFHRIWGRFERNEQGGGTWIIQGGMNGATQRVTQMKGEDSSTTTTESVSARDKKAEESRIPRDPKTNPPSSPNGDISYASEGY